VAGIANGEIKFTFRGKYWKILLQMSYHQLSKSMSAPQNRKSLTQQPKGHVGGRMLHCYVIWPVFCTLDDGCDGHPKYV